MPVCAGCGREIREFKHSLEDAFELVTEEGEHYCLDCLEYFTRDEKWKIFQMVRASKEIGDYTKARFEDIMGTMESFPSFAYVQRK